MALPGAWFPGDDDDALKDVQAGCMPGVLRSLVEGGHRAVQQAERLLGVETPLGHRLRRLQSFDVRPLRAAHDVLAAAFRRDVWRGAQADLFVHTRLGPPPEARDLMIQEWWAFVRRESEGLREEPTLLRLLLQCAAPESDAQLGAAAAALATAFRVRYRFE